MVPACALTTVAILAALLFFVLLLLNRTMELRFSTSYAMVDCAPPPDDGAAAFRGTLLPLLAALRVAAAPTKLGLTAGSRHGRRLAIWEHCSRAFDQLQTVH
ncbi:hypothetical protein D1007_60499 [Hordeum vulgare]|nr:hypothetical protein D1007_60499 [Hordeum vulgare]